MSLRDVQQRYGIRFKKALGQNLLLDENINRIMVDAASLSDQDYVVEVGAGLGALTGHIAKRANRVLAIEIDRSFMPCLEDQFGEAANVSLFRGDVLNHSLANLVDEFIPNGPAYKMISNLPYYITTPILFHFWESDLFFDRIVIMVQEEVGLRMTATLGRRDYGVLALASKYYAEVDIVHKVPRTCFLPQPKVDSCIVRFRNRKQSLYPDIEKSFLLGLIRAAFVHRRKTLRNSLSRSSTLEISIDAIDSALEEAGIEPSRRPQTLTLDEYAGLARALQPVQTPSG